MNILTNEKTIRRNSRIGSYTMFAGLGLVVVSMVLLYKMNDTQFLQDNPNIVIWTMATLFGGFMVVQIGTFFTNRYGRRPRTDEVLGSTLKGLTKDYTLYNYLAPVNHLLVGPAGVWVIEPYYQRGTIGYDSKRSRWTQSGGGFYVAYMKIFGQEGIGRPDLEVKADVDSLAAAFKKAFGDEVPEINVALVFTDPRTEVNAEDAPQPTMMVKDLKDFLRKYAKGHPFPADQIERITAALPEETIE